MWEWEWVCVHVCEIRGNFKADTNLNYTFKELGQIQEVRHTYKSLSSKAESNMCQVVDEN